jgi:hypothetical protein
MTTTIKRVSRRSGSRRSSHDVEEERFHRPGHGRTLGVGRSDAANVNRLATGRQRVAASVWRALEPVGARSR